MASKDQEVLRRIREVCGPFDHVGHIVSDIEKAMDDYLSIGIGPWFFITKSHKDRWDEQAKAGGGKKGKLRGTQLHYGEPTAYRALVAVSFNGNVGIELIQPYNDEPSCHNDWLKSRGNGIQHINFTVPAEHHPEIIEACTNVGWVRSIELLNDAGKEHDRLPENAEVPNVIYFDLMKEFGYHIELARAPAIEGGGYAEEKRWHAYMCYLCSNWDGVTDPIRYAFPKVPDDFRPDLCA